MKRGHNIDRIVIVFFMPGTKITKYINIHTWMCIIIFLVKLHSRKCKKIPFILLMFLFLNNTRFAPVFSYSHAAENYIHTISRRKSILIIYTERHHLLFQNANKKAKNWCTSFLNTIEYSQWYNFLPLDVSSVREAPPELLFPKLRNTTDMSRKPTDRFYCISTKLGRH